MTETEQAEDGNTSGNEITSQQAAEFNDPEADSRLAEYGEMFSYRYTEKDAVYSEYEAVPLLAPPCVENWRSAPKRNRDWNRGGNRDGGRGSYRGHGHGNWERDRSPHYQGRREGDRRENRGEGRRDYYDRGYDREGRRDYRDRGFEGPQGGRDWRGGRQGRYGDRHQPYHSQHRRGNYR